MKNVLSLRPGKTSPIRVSGLAPDQHITVVLPDGFKMRFLVVNPGAPVSLFFVHGFGVSPDLVHGLLLRLATDHNATVYAPYLPNHGRSDNVSSYTDLVDRIGQAAEMVGMSHSVFVGHSLGGHIITCLASSRPDLLSAVIGLATPNILLTYGVDMFRLMSTLATDATLTTTLAFGEALVHRDGIYMTSALANGCYRGLRSVTILAALQGAPDLRRVMANVAQPVNFLYGGLDLAVRRPHVELGENFSSEVLSLFPHNLTMLPKSFDRISAAVGRALGTSGVIAPVIPLSTSFEGVV